MPPGGSPSQPAALQPSITNADARTKHTSETQNRNGAKAKRERLRAPLKHEQGKLERTMVPSPTCPSDSDRGDASAEHTLRREPIPTQATRRREPRTATNHHGSLSLTNVRIIAHVRTLERENREFHNENETQISGTNR